MNQTAVGNVDFMTAPTDDLISRLRKIQELKTKIKAIDTKRDALADELAVLEKEALLMLDNAGIDSIKIDGKTMFKRIDTYMSVNPELQDRAFMWLRDNDLGELIKETVNSRSLASALKEIPADEIPDSIRISKVERIGMRAR